MRKRLKIGNLEWLPAFLAVLAFVGFLVAFGWELLTYQHQVVEWARRDLQSRADLAAANLEEPLRTQDLGKIRAFGEQRQADGERLTVSGLAGGRIFDSWRASNREEPSFSAQARSGEYVVAIGIPPSRVSAPFRRAIHGFLLAAFVGMAGVLSFFFITYRQRVRIRELAELERFRREFIADVSHEIKTPLTGILGAADLMDANTPLVTMIKKEAKRLHALVQSILDLARLEREGELLNREEIELVAFVREVVESQIPMARSANIALSFASAWPNLTARIDPRLLSQAMTNLIANAIRHSRSPLVRVSLERDSKMLRLAVEDRGVGIPADQAARIFDRFYRVDPARAAETGGAGLGLAIVRRIARLHGGEVSCRPATPRGSIFTISLPLTIH